MCETGPFIVSDTRGLAVELSSQFVKKYPTPAPPLTGSSTPIVPVDAPALIHIVNGSRSDPVPEATPPRKTVDGCDDGNPFVWIVSKYCNCQFHVTLEAALIVKVIELIVPVAGTLPVPVHPVVVY